MALSGLRPTLALLSAALLGACGGSTRVRDILERPADFEGKTVTVSGTVVESTNVIVLRFYKVDDGTGRIAVVTQRAVPRKGATVKATGVVHQAFSIGDESLTVLVAAEP